MFSSGFDGSELIRRLMNPAAVAVVGASRRLDSIGGAIFANLRRDGFTGALVPINRTAEEVQGIRAYPTVSSVGRPIDLAVIAVPASHVEAVVDDCIEAKVAGLVIISAGFAETSEEGRRVEARIRDKVRAAGLRMVGPNCMGVLNTDARVRLNATFTPVWPPEGNIAILTQSGALGLTILEQVKDLNLGISTFVSVGNKADVSGNDLLTYWKDDPNTDVILLYLESFGNPRKFARLAPEVVRRKPIVAVKAGRSAAGRRAAASHSASLATLDVAVDALFEQAGVIRTDTLEEMFDVAALLATQPPPRGPRVGVVTNAGGPGILFADACEARGLSLPPLSPSTIAALHEFLPHHAALTNPVDMVGTDDPAFMERATRIVGADPNIDSLVVIFIPPLQTTRPADVAASIVRGAADIPADRPVLSVFLATRGTPDVLLRAARRPIPSFKYPENAAMALAAAHRRARWMERRPGRAVQLHESRRAEVRLIVDHAVRNQTESVWLAPNDVASVLESAEISFARSIEADLSDAPAAALGIGYPLVVKAVLPGVTHKSDVGGVAVDIRNEREMCDAMSAMAKRLSRHGQELKRVLLQRFVPDGIEMFIGVTSDPVFGPLVVCGLGGVQVELLKDVAFRLTPVREDDAAEMIQSLRSSPLLDGYRGAPPGDRDALVRTIMQVSALVESIPELTELDLNPVKVLRPGEGVVAVDARIRV